jgi:integrase
VPRSLTTKYRDQRVRQPDFPLAEAVGWFVDDMRFEVRPTTWATYRSWTTLFAAQHHVLSDLTPANVERFVRASKNQHTAMNRAISLKRFGRYLADKRLWYTGDKESVLRDVRQPRALPNGQPPYNDAEIRTILMAVAQGAQSERNRVAVLLLLHGLRANEVRCLQLRNVILPTYRENGHVIIETDTKTASANRSLPLEPFAVEPIRQYVRAHRPRFRGDGLEPLILTDAGLQFTLSGWHTMAQRLRRLVAEEGIPFRQHRLRSTSVRLAHEKQWPDSVNIALHGWSPRTGQQMLARYRGPIPVEQMKKYPPRFAGILRVI